LEEEDMNTDSWFGFEKETPWGKAQSADLVAPGIVVVSTPGHGGVKLSPEFNAKVPKAGRDYAERWVGGEVGWYEEDVAAGIPILMFPELAEYFGKWNGGAEIVRNNARESLTRYVGKYLVDALERAVSQVELELEGGVV
jgi:hypothetical protein